MVKKTVIELVTVTVEDKLESNGALRNVAVKDAWKRFRQKIEVKSWKEAEGVLQELTDSLQKIKLLKSVSSFINKLKTAISMTVAGSAEQNQTFQNPEEMVDENEFAPKDTPREDKSRTLELANDLQKSLDEISKLEDFLRTVKQKLESSNDPPPISPSSTFISGDMKSCYESISAICDTYRKTVRELEKSNGRVENLESKTKDVENKLEDKESQINHLIAAIDTLEKKHNNMKEQKMDTFKDQMKVKSLERQVEAKDRELKKAKEELSDLKQRFDTLMKSKIGDTGESNNPYPPAKIADKYMELFKAERAAAVNFYKTTEKKNDRDASTRAIDLLKECYMLCETISYRHLEELATLLLNPSSTEPVKQESKDKLEDADMKTLISIRKSTCKQTVEPVKSAVISFLEETHTQKFSLAEITGCLPYIEKCVEVCWPAVIQSTPLLIDFDTKGSEKPEVNSSKPDINPAMFEIVDGKGKKMDYVIWPPLLNFKGGQVLRKGQIKVQ